MAVLSDEVGQVDVERRLVEPRRRRADAHHDRTQPLAVLVDDRQQQLLDVFAQAVVDAADHAVVQAGRSIRFPAAAGCRGAGRRGRGRGGRSFPDTARRRGGRRRPGRCRWPRSPAAKRAARLRAIPSPARGRSRVRDTAAGCAPAGCRRSGGETRPCGAARGRSRARGAVRAGIRPPSAHGR